MMRKSANTQVDASIVGPGSKLPLDNGEYVIFGEADVIESTEAGNHRCRASQYRALHLSHGPALAEYLQRFIDERPPNGLAALVGLLQIGGVDATGDENSGIVVAAMPQRRYWCAIAAFPVRSSGTRL